jgi:hypothetical protein
MSKWLFVHTMGDEKNPGALSDTDPTAGAGAATTLATRALTFLPAVVSAAFRFLLGIVIFSSGFSCKH